ncbi:hypothetical protein HY624_04100 [Candidatus Uhrbacteria bacterium]|nr:hypothetical protein [Candidatus Uhrbacteria bacterium]
MARKQKNSRPVNPMEEALMNIYKDTDGSVPDLSHFERRGRYFIHPLLWGVIVIFLLIAGASAISFYYFAPRTREATGRTVRLLMEGPKEAVSGAKTTYIITYVNDERVALNDAEIRVQASAGFTLDHAEPKSSKNGMVWSLGRIETGGHGSIQLVGTAVGSVAEPLTLNALFTYTRDNFSSNLEERSSIQTIVRTAPLTITLEGPDQLVIGEAATYVARVENQSETPLTNVVARVTLPSGARASNLPKNAEEEKSEQVSVTAAEATVVMIPIGVIGPSDSVKQQFAVTLPQPADGGPGAPLVTAVATFRAAVGLRVTESFFMQSETEMTVEVVAGGFVTRLAANGISGEGAIRWDDTITTTVSYENRGKVPAENVEIRVAMTGDAIDWTTFKDARKGVVKNGEIRWTKRELPALALVKAKATGALTFTVRLRAPGDEALKGAAKDARISIEGTALITKFGKTLKDVVTTMEPVHLAVNTDAAFRSELRYFSEDNIPYGSGPLPPRVGEPTTYRAFIRVTNHLHELRSIEVRTTLPLFVEWTGKTVVSAGEMKYDSMTREVRWTLNRMPTTVEKIETQFEVRFVPLPEHGKTTVTLIPEMTFDAVDGVTQGKLHFTQSALTTALPDDPEAKGKGIVVE